MPRGPADEGARARTQERGAIFEDEKSTEERSMKAVQVVLNREMNREAP